MGRRHRTQPYCIECLESRTMLMGEGVLTPAFPYAAVNSQLLGGPEISVVEKSDLNGDGKMDWITGAIVGNRGVVKVVLDVDGQLTPNVQINILGGINDIELADVDLDGDVDLVLANASQILVYANQGNDHLRGWLGFKKFTTFASNASNVVLRDLNGDQFPDLAAVASSDGRLVVHLGSGDGTFDEGIQYEGERWILADDVNHDGFVDLVTSRASQKGVMVRLNDGWGIFDAVSFSNEHRFQEGFALVDINGDDQLDLIADQQIWPGNGDGTFADDRPILYESAGPVTSVLAADVTLDGILDLLIGESHYLHHRRFADSLGGISVAQGDGNGVYQPAVRLSEPDPLHVFVEELDGRIAIGAVQRFVRLPQAGITESFPTRIVWFEHAPNFGIGESVTTFGKDALDGVQFEDLNHDGILDALGYLEFTDEIVSMFLSNAEGGYEQTHFQPPLSDVQISRIDVGDFDGNGTRDFYVENSSAGQEHLTLLGNGNTTFWITDALGFASNWHVAEVADFDGDGRDDLLAIDETLQGQRGLAVYRFGVEEKWQRWGDATPMPGTSFSFRQAVHLNDDDWLDVVTLEDSASSADRLSLLHGKETGGFETALTVEVHGSWRLDDYNADNLPDLVVQTQEGIEFYFGDTAGGFTDGSRHSLQVTSILGSEDFDGDGHAELVVIVGDALATYSLVDSGLLLHESIPLGGVQSPLAPISSLDIVDLNGDEISDFVLSFDAYNSQPPLSFKFAILLGTGDGLLHESMGNLAIGVSPIRATPFFSARPTVDLTFADVDRDGDLDILAGHRDGISIITNDFAPIRDGDLDRNGTVDFADFLILAANFGRRDATRAQGDINNDQAVTFADFLLLSANFGVDQDKNQNLR